MTMIKFVLTFLAALTIAVLVTLLLAWPVQLLWNWVMPRAVYWAKEITWLEAWGLLFLAHILIKSDVKVNSNKD